MSEKCDSYYREAEEVNFNFGSENLDNSHKQALCGNVEQIVTKLDSSHAAIIQIVKSDFATELLTSLSEKKIYSRPTKKISANRWEWKLNTVSFIHIGW